MSDSQEMDELKKEETTAERTARYQEIYDRLQYEFIPQSEPTQRTSAKCKICHTQFAARVKRMEAHRQWCSPQVLNQYKRPSPHLKHQAFYDKMQFQYLSMQEGDGKPGVRCLVCNKSLRMFKISSLKNHREWACRPQLLSSEPTKSQRKAPVVFKKHPIIKRQAIYDELRFRYVQKHENDGVSGIKCLVCNLMFRCDAKERTLRRHRESGCPGQSSTVELTENNLNKSSTDHFSEDDSSMKMEFESTEDNMEEYGDIHKFETLQEVGDAYFDFESQSDDNENQSVDMDSTVDVKQNDLANIEAKLDSNELQNQETEQNVNYDLYDPTAQTANNKKRLTRAKCKQCQQVWLLVSEDSMNRHNDLCRMCKGGEQRVPEQKSIPGYRDVEIADGTGHIKTVKECMGCHISFASTDKKHFQQHEFQCFASVRDCPTSTENDPTSLHMRLGFTRVCLPKSAKRQTGYSCRLCKRILIKYNVTAFKAHRKVCEALTVEEKLILAKLRYKTKFLIQIDGKTNRVAECCLCHLKILNLSLESLKKHRLTCKNNDATNEIDIDKANDTDAFVALNPTKRKKIHIQRGAPLYVENGFIIKITEADGIPQRFYQCLTCNSLLKRACSLGIEVHRKKCKLTKTVAYKKGETIPFIDANTPIESISFNYHEAMKNTNEIMTVLRTEETSEDSNSNGESVDHDFINDQFDPNQQTVTTEPSDDLRAQRCYICNRKSEFYFHNLYEMKSKYSKTRFCDFITRWLGDNPSKRVNGFSATPDDNSCVCVDCVNRINEYDVMYTTAQQIDKELRDTFMRTESLAYVEPKIEPNDEVDKGIEVSTECVEVYENFLDPTTGQVTQNLTFSSTTGTQINLNKENHEDLLGSSFDNALDFDVDECDDGDDKDKETAKTMKKCDTILDSLAVETLEHSVIDCVPIKKAIDNHVYNCKKCPAQYRDNTKFELHILSHTQDAKVSKLPFKCIKCNIDLKEDAAFKEHMHLHEELLENQCVFCQKIICDKFKIPKHVRSCQRIRESEYQCDMCGILVHAESSFRSHMMRVHPPENMELVSCDHCNKEFRLLCDLRKHITIHLGNKPHVCKICGKRFRVPYSLREHELTHDKAEQQRRKIYPCTLCSKRFQFRNQVKFHMQKRHSIMDPRLPQTQEIPK